MIVDADNEVLESNEGNNRNVGESIDSDASSREVSREVIASRVKNAALGVENRVHLASVGIKIPIS